MQLDRDTDAFCRALAGVLAERRKEKGLSLTRMGSDAGLSQQIISYMEKGARIPTVGTLYRICRALEIDVSEVFARTESELRARRPSARSPKGR